MFDEIPFSTIYDKLSLHSEIKKEVSLWNVDNLCVKIFILCGAETDVNVGILCNFHINVQIVNKKLRLLHEIVNNCE